MINKLIYIMFRYLIRLCEALIDQRNRVNILVLVVRMYLNSALEYVYAA